MSNLALRNPLKDPSEWEVRGYRTTMTTILFIIAAILVIYGIVSLVRGDLLMGALLIVVGLLVGPGGYSIFR